MLPLNMFLTFNLFLYIYLHFSHCSLLPDYLFCFNFLNPSVIFLLITTLLFPELTIQIFIMSHLNMFLFLFFDDKLFSHRWHWQGMNFPVCLHISTNMKSFATNFTWKWSLVIMSVHKAFESIQVKKKPLLQNGHTCLSSLCEHSLYEYLTANLMHTFYHTIYRE